MAKVNINRKFLSSHSSVLFQIRISTWRRKWDKPTLSVFVASKIPLLPFFFSHLAKSWLSVMRRELWVVASFLCVHPGQLIPTGMTGIWSCLLCEHLVGKPGMFLFESFPLMPLSTFKCDNHCVSLEPHCFLQLSEESHHDERKVALLEVIHM